MGRSGSQLSELIRQIAVGALQNVQLKFELGELTDYDPTTHTAKFILPQVTTYDPSSGQDIAQETGFVPIGTFFSGPAFGAQFPPVQGDQALILFLDHYGSNPMAAVFFYNQIETPPYPDGKTWGWKDQTNNEIKTTQDGATEGDGLGGARVVGASYSSVVAPKVELGQEGLSDGQEVVRKQDLQAVIDQINNFIALFNAHLHAGVASGGGNTAPPVTPAQDFNDAQASPTVAAN